MANGNFYYLEKFLFVPLFVMTIKMRGIIILYFFSHTTHCVCFFVVVCMSSSVHVILPAISECCDWLLPVCGDLLLPVCVLLWAIYKGV